MKKKTIFVISSAYRCEDGTMYCVDAELADSETSALARIVNLIKADIDGHFTDDPAQQIINMACGGYMKTDSDCTITRMSTYEYRVEIGNETWVYHFNKLEVSV